MVVNKKDKSVRTLAVLTLFLFHRKVRELLYEIKKPDIFRYPDYFRVAGAGFEPTTFGL